MLLKSFAWCKVEHKVYEGGCLWKNYFIWYIPWNSECEHNFFFMSWLEMEIVMKACGWMTWEREKEFCMAVMAQCMRWVYSNDSWWLSEWGKFTAMTEDASVYDISFQQWQMMAWCMRWVYSNDRRCLSVWYKFPAITDDGSEYEVSLQ